MKALTILLHACLCSVAMIGGLSAQTEKSLPTQEDFMARFPKTRPRIFIKSWQWLDSRLEKFPEMRKMRSDIIKRADKHLTTPLVEHEIVNGRLLDVSRTIVSRVCDLSYAYQATKDKRYSTKAIAEMKAVSAFPDWNPGHFLDIGEMCLGMAVGYDWLHDIMKPEERQTVGEAIVAKGLKVYLEHKKKWWSRTNSNWAGVCHGGVGVAALAVSDRDPQLAAAVLENAFVGLNWKGGYLEEYAPDGGWTESPAYWGYGTSYLVYLMAALESSLNSSMGLAETPGLSRTGRFPIDMLGAKGDQLFNYGDGPSKPLTQACFFWLGRKYRDPLLLWYQQKHHRSSIFDLIWYKDLGKSPDTLNLKKDAYYRGVEVVAFRTAWSDPLGTSLMFKAGNNKVGHSHLDLGEFILEARGVRWIRDLGNDAYARPGYLGHGTDSPTGTRWTYYRARAEANNTMVINPTRLVPQKITGDQDPSAETQIKKFRSNGGSIGFAIADLTDAYEPFGAVFARRGIAMINNRKRILVQDEVKMTDSSDYYHFLTLGVSHSGVSLKGNTAILKSGKESLECRILEPEGAVFQLLKSEQIKGVPRPAKQAPEGAARLAVALKNVENALVRVIFTPVIEGAPELPLPKRYLLTDPRWPEGKK